MSHCTTREYTKKNPRAQLMCSLWAACDYQPALNWTQEVIRNPYTDILQILRLAIGLIRLDR